jgi:hypothetical protein
MRSRSRFSLSQAVFLNREELPIKALYRDPTHDFGFFQYDPAALQFLGPVRSGCGCGATAPLCGKRHRGAACARLRARIGHDGARRRAALGTIRAAARAARSARRRSVRCAALRGWRGSASRFVC